jgi:hypothetical protein
MLSYLGLNLSELYVLTAALNAQQASEREEKKGSNDDIQNRTAATFIQSCWRRFLATIVGKKRTPKASKRG